MSITATFSVFCDGPDCIQWVAEARSVAHARAHAKSFGWKRAKRDGRMVDLCAVCGDAACLSDGRVGPMWCITHQCPWPDGHARCDAIEQHLAPTGSHDGS